MPAPFRWACVATRSRRSPRWSASSSASARRAPTPSRPSASRRCGPARSTSSRPGSTSRSTPARPTMSSATPWCGTSLAECEAVAARRGVGLAIEPFMDSPATPMDPDLSAACEEAIAARGHPPLRLPSGAATTRRDGGSLPVGDAVRPLHRRDQPQSGRIRHGRGRGRRGTGAGRCVKRLAGLSLLEMAAILTISTIMFFLLLGPG